MRWIHVHIEGLVQGVGFRPFVFKLATGLDIKGWVCNGVDGVHLEVGGREEQVAEFIEQLKMQAPEESYITRFVVDEISELELTDFSIVDSNPLGTPNLLITPDLGLCNECREEDMDQTDLLSQTHNHTQGILL